MYCPIPLPLLTPVRSYRKLEEEVVKGGGVGSGPGEGVGGGSAGSGVVEEPQVEVKRKQVEFAVHFLHYMTHFAVKLLMLSSWYQV